MRIHLLLLLLLLAVTIAASSHAAERPNVLFIIADDLNCNIGAYGYPMVQTPHLNQLTKEGLLFQNAYTNYPSCGQSPASFMTGLYPQLTGVTQLRRLFRDHVPDAVTMAQHCQRHGYTTGRVGKIYHPDVPLEKGSNGHDDPASWDVRVSPLGRDRIEEDKILSVTPGKFGASLSWYEAEGADEKQTDGMVATESIRVLEHFSDSDEPVLLVVGFYRPHTPFIAPKKYLNLYDPTEIAMPRVPTGYLDALPTPAAKSIRKREADVDLDEATARKAMHACYASISFVDTLVGRVLAAVDALGLREKPVVLFTSDHGYHMAEHGYYQKGTLFGDSDRVPLILSAAGMSIRGQMTDAIMEMIDFYRTLSDLADVPDPEPFVLGESFAAVLDNAKLSARPGAITQLVNGYSLRTPRYRYTQWRGTAGLPNEPYDRLSDPSEIVNLVNDPAYADVIPALRDRLNARIPKGTTPVDGLKFIPPDPRSRPYARTQLAAAGLAGETQATWAPAPVC